MFIKLYIYQKILKNIVYHHFHTKYANLFLTFSHDLLEIITIFFDTHKTFLIIITENWSNDEYTSALHHKNNITFWKLFFLFVIIFHYITVLFYIILIT